MAEASANGSEGVTFLEEPYTLGDTRAMMIEGRAARR